VEDETRLMHIFISGFGIIHKESI